MIGHAGVFLTILALAMGGISLAHTLHLYQNTRLRFLKIFNWFFILINYMVFMGLAFNYFQFNIGPHLSRGLARKIFQTYHFQLSVVSFIVLYCFITLMMELMKKRWSRKWQIVFFTIYGLLILSQVIFSFIDPFIGKVPVYILFLLVIFFSADIFIYVLVFRIILQTSSIPNSTKQQSLKKLALLILIISIPDTIMDFMQIFDLLSLGLYVFLKAMEILVVNLLPFLFMKGFVQKMFPEHFPAFETGPPVNYQFQKYKISNREQEIIQLICQGKSNREIEDELYISLQTVKDHVHNIFQKTGVKNRVQLTNLFRRSGE